MNTMDFASSSNAHAHAHGATLSFTSTPDAKVAPFVVSGAAFVGKTIVGGVIGGAASWGVNRILDNRFPSRR
jgi:hypothetical protein